MADDSDDETVLSTSSSKAVMQTEDLLVKVRKKKQTTSSSKAVMQTEDLLVKVRKKNKMRKKNKTKLSNKFSIEKKFFGNFEVFEQKKIIDWR